MKSHQRVFSSLVIIALAVLFAIPSVVNAQVVSPVGTSLAQEDDCVDEIMTAVMEVVGIEDEDEFIAYVGELEYEDIEALLEEAGVSELAENCDFDMEVSCEELVMSTLSVMTEIEDEEELIAYIEGLEEEEQDALFEEAGLLLVQSLLMEATGIEDLEELEAYLETITEEELEVLFEESGINDLEEACEDDVDIEDLPELCLEEIFVVLSEATGIEDEDELIAYVEELEEDDLDTLLDENGIYDIIEACDVDESPETEEVSSE